MANYKPITFSKEAEQIPVQPVDAPPVSTHHLVDFEVYRDQSGHYTLVNTKYGQQRGNETDWIMAEVDAIPSVPEVPAVPGVQATGSFTVANNAAGDGIVGFNYNGIIYSVAPAASDTPAVTAQALVDLVNLGGQMIAVLNGAIVEITVISTGVAGNVTLIDVTADSTQTGAVVGLSGGVDYAYAIPETPAIPAVFSVWTDVQFNELYEVV